MDRIRDLLDRMRSAIDRNRRTTIYHSIAQDEAGSPPTKWSRATTYGDLRAKITRRRLIVVCLASLVVITTVGLIVKLVHREPPPPASARPASPSEPFWKQYRQYVTEPWIL